MDMLSTLTVVNTSFVQCLSYGNVRRTRRLCRGLRTRPLTVPACAQGGAIVVRDAHTTISNSRFESCGEWGYTYVRARKRGSSPSLLLLVRALTAQHFFARAHTQGGALYIVPYWLNASATFDTVSFVGNQGTVGGALYVDFGTPQAVVSGTGCVFADNLAGVKVRAMRMCRYD
jgi:hypothetical protein